MGVCENGTYFPSSFLTSTISDWNGYRSYSKLMAFEASRILHRLGCDVRIFNPSQLPIRDSVPDTHPSVQELRSLSSWSDGHVWVSPDLGSLDEDVDDLQSEQFADGVEELRG
jgi:hypothetical protein